MIGIKHETKLQSCKIKCPDVATFFLQKDIINEIVTKNRVVNNFSLDLYCISFSKIYRSITYQFDYENIETPLYPMAYTDNHGS